MKKLFCAFVVLLYGALKLSAQDLNKGVEPIGEVKKDISPAKTSNPLIFNYNSGSINNVFNQDLRRGGINRVTLDFDYLGNSNSVPAAFEYSLLFQRDLSKSLIDRADNHIKKQLLFEDFMKTGLTYTRYQKKWDGMFYLSYNHRQMRNIVSSKNAFEFIFYGNARFAGDTADFSNIRFQNFIYNQYSGGIKKKVDYGKYQMEMGVGLSFLQVINAQDIHTGNSWIYTAVDGDTLKINYDITVNSAKEGATKFFELNGIGASGDFHFAVMNNDNWKISLDIADVGYMAFRKNEVNYSGARYVEFTGIVLPDLLHFSSQTFDTLNLDSAVRSYLPVKSANRFSMMVPFTANLVFSKSLAHHHLVLSAGLQYRHLPHYYVYGYLKVNYFIKPDLIFSVSGGAGVYSLFNFGLELAKSWKYFDFALGSGNVIGLAAAKYYTGTSVYLRLGTSF